MHEDIYVVSFLVGLQLHHVTVAAASPVQAIRVVQRDARCSGLEPLNLIVELLCPGALLPAP